MIIPKEIDFSDKILYNEVYLPYLDNYFKDLLIFYGGSSSGKSKFVAQRNIINILRGDRNYLVCRKVADTIKHTVYTEYKKAIFDFRLNNCFTFNETNKIIKCKNGFRILFKGLDDPEKVKSLIFEKGVLTDIHIEEATDINSDDYDVLSLRLRGKYKDVKKQIVMTFNPINQLHWIKKRFFDFPTENVEILKTTYKDNSFLTEQDVRKIEAYKDIDKYYYDVYALGNWGVLGNLVFNNWAVDDLTELQDKFNTYYFGLDFGFTNDPSAILKVALKQDNIYILDEIYEKGLDNNEIAKRLKIFAGNKYVYCDNAEPKSIKELRDYGIQALAVSKGKDSVKHGIQWIRQKKILIDKRCRFTINELQTYKYREDKDGNVLNEPVDMNNHSMDALRYALENMMRMNEIKIPGISASSLGL